MSDLIQLFTSKKVLAGPASASGMLIAGQITGWQWTAITLGYVLIQGAVDVVEKRYGPKPIDQQNGPSVPTP